MKLRQLLTFHFIYDCMQCNIDVSAEAFDLAFYNNEVMSR